MMKQLLIKLKYFLEKKALSLGVVLLLIFAFFMWLLKPAYFYQQQIGIVEEIKETSYYLSSYKSTGPGRTQYAYILNINGEEYRIWKVDNENYDYLIGKKILFRFQSPTWLVREKQLKEIIYEGRIIVTPNQNIGTFIKCVILFFLFFIWVIWGAVKQWKKIPIPIQKANNNDEETFFENWAVRKKNDKCTLAYVSKLDGTVKHIKISLDDYESAKNGNMNLNDFSKKYNLW